MSIRVVGFYKGDDQSQDNYIVVPILTLSLPERISSDV